MKLTQHMLRILAAFILFIGSNIGYAQSTLVGSIPASYDVTSGGSFQYTVPLRIPPGIKDMIPNLAVNYNSQGGDGVLGRGWYLSGLSAITRGGSTIYHDNSVGAADFNDDVLFLDGQRLLQDGSYYLTEVKNFAKIELVSNDYFRVEYPNGMIYEYGRTTDSKMLAQGRSDVLMWAINKIEDVHGNYISFTYTSNQTTGEYRIKSIIYGGNSKPTTVDIISTINFTYSSRNDGNKTWIAGSEILSNVLLTDIEILFDDSSQANKYHFTYDGNIQTSKHSRLTKIEELRDGSHSLPPINITWGNTADSPTTTFQYVYPHSAYIVSGDFNGDGLTDILATDSSRPSLTSRVYLRNKNTISFNQPDTIVVRGVTSINSAQYKIALDYNGDGFDDILEIYMEGRIASVHPHPEIWVNLIKSNGSSFDNPVQLYYASNSLNSPSAADNYLKEVRFTTGDYDGDGKAELVLLQPYHFSNPNSVADYEIFVIGDEYGAHKIYHYSGHIDNINTINYNGDGKDEFFVSNIAGGTDPISQLFELSISYDGALKPHLNQTSTTWPVNITSTSIFPHTYLKNWPGDYNGDGKTDFISWKTLAAPPAQWMLAYSDGTYPTYSNRWAAVNPSPLMPTLGAYNAPYLNPIYTSYHTGDFNGDGLSDFIKLETKSNIGLDSSKYDVFFSTGTGFTQQSGVVQITADGEKIALGDYNGDGQTDIISSVDGFTILSFQKDNKCLTITAIENAGKTVQFEQMPLTQDSSYVKSTLSNYLYNTKIAPVKVIKHVYDDVSLNNTYTYEGLLRHKYGLGIRGFNKMHITNSSYQNIHKTYNVLALFPYLSEEQYYDPLVSLPYGRKITYNQLDIYGGGGMSRIIVPYTESIIDYINASIIENRIVTGLTGTNTVFYEYGKIDSMISLGKDLNGNKVSLSITKTVYGSNWATNKGKPESTITYNELDPSGSNSVTSQVNYTYNSDGTLAIVTSDPGTINSLAKSYSYNNHGNIEKTELEPYGITKFTESEIEYTNDGRFTQKITDAENYSVKYGYGSIPLRACWGNVLVDTNTQGLITTYEYDALNRQIVKTSMDLYKNNPVGGISVNLKNFSTYEWATGSTYTGDLPNAYSMVTSTNNDNATFKVDIFDKYGRVIRTVNNDFLGWAVYQDLEYNATGLPYKTTPKYRPGSKVETEYSYDEYNRKRTSTTSMGGPSFQTDYAITGGVLETTTTNVLTGNYRTTVSCGDITLQSKGVNEQIDYTYYGNGATRTVTTNGLTVTNILDDYGRLKTNTQPNAGTKTYSYDALGRIVQETLGTGVSYTYTYDKLNRLLTKFEVGQTTPYTFSYIPAGTGIGQDGNLEETTSPNTSGTSPASFSVKYYYNSIGKVSKKEEKSLFPALPFPLPTHTNNTHPTSYLYDGCGRLVKYRFYNDLTIGYAYNGVGQIDSIYTEGGRSNNHLLWFIWGRDHRGNLTEAYLHSRTNQNIYAVSNSFDVHGYPQSRTALNRKTGVVPIVSYEYEFDYNNGNLRSRTDNIKTFKEEFTFDAEFNRLTQASSSTHLSMPVLDISYDNKGNILKKSDVSTNLSPSNDYFDWKYNDYALLTVPFPASSTPAFEIPSNTLETDYYPFQKLKRAWEDGKNEVFFDYGPGDERVKATYYDKPGATTTWKKSKYYGENYELIEEVNGTKELFYVWAEDELVSIIRIQTSKTALAPDTPEVYYPIRDHLGSITHLVDDRGVTNFGVVDERSYDAWGRVRDNNTFVPFTKNNFPTTWITDRGYTGHEHLSLDVWNNNIINMDGRLYDPLCGRMFSPDLVTANSQNSQDYNKYTYARNNPLKYTDPDGNNVFVGAAIGGTINLAANAIKGNVHSFQSAARYFAVGAMGGAFTSNLSGGSNFGNGVAGGFIGSYIVSSGNASIGGASVQDATQTGINSGLSGAVVGGVFGLFNDFWGCNNGTFVHGSGEVIGDPPTQEEIDYARTFNDENMNTDLAGAIGDERFFSDLPSGVSKLKVGAPGREYSNFGTGGDYGLELGGNGRIIGPNGARYLGLTLSDPSFHGSHVFISPLAYNFRGTALNYRFRAILGHELIHAYNYRRWLPNQAIRQYDIEYSENAAYTFERAVYQKFNDDVNAGRISNIMPLRHYNFSNALYTNHPYTP